MNSFAWNKLIFLFAGVFALIILNNIMNLDSFLGLEKEEAQKTPSFQVSSPTPTKNLVSPTSIAHPSPTPTITKSIPRIRFEEFEDD